MPETLTAQHDTGLFVYHGLTPPQVEHYRERGFLLVGRTVTDRGLALMRRECDEVWAGEGRRFDPTTSSRQNILLSDVHRHAETVRRYYFQGPLVDLAEALIGPNVKAAASQLTYKMRGNTQRVPWHQDNGYGELDPYNSITTLTALEDVDEGNGCLWIAPGWHRRGALPTSRFDHSQPGKDIAADVDEADAVPVRLKAGEALMIHVFMPHKSEGNPSPSRDRRMLFLRYADADAVEVYRDRRPRLGRLVRGVTRFPEVEAFEADLG